MSCGAAPGDQGERTRSVTPGEHVSCDPVSGTSSTVRA